MRGTVRDVSGGAVPGAQIAAVDGGAGAISDSAGHFLLHGLASGSLVFVVRRIGYDPGQFSLNVRASDTTDVDVTVVAAVPELPGVVARSTAPVDVVLAKFYDHRAASGGGHFLTRADIEKANPLHLSDLLRAIPGMTLRSDPNGRNDARVNRSNLGAFGDCPPVYWIDGSRAAEFNLDELAVRDVEALEIYAGPATIPPEYRTTRAGTACGVIAVWTRVP